MTDPQATFSIFAEISIALAGFSGIVIALGHHSNSGLGRLEIRRLTNLFILSGFSLFMSLLAISLLHLQLSDQTLLWRAGSAIVLLLGTPWLTWDVIRVSRLEKAERAQVNPYILVTFNSLAMAMLLLQVANCLFIAGAWPLLLGLVLTIAGAFQQFILLVKTGFNERPRT